MKALCAYWADGYDWRKWEAELNRFAQFTARVEDIDIHFYRVEGSGPPLILSHGWPGSVFEFLHIIDKLARTSPSSCRRCRATASPASRSAPSARARSRGCSTG